MPLKNLTIERFPDVDLLGKLFRLRSLLCFPRDMSDVEHSFRLLCFPRDMSDVEHSFRLLCLPRDMPDVKDYFDCCAPA